jgi:hypothetical protein
MNRAQKFKFAIAELTKAQRKVAPEANIYCKMNKDPALEKFWLKYKDFAEVIQFLEDLSAQKELF